MNKKADRTASVAPHGEQAIPERINDLLITTIQELLQTSSRETAERAVCTRLVESDFYQFAWIGECQLEGHRVVSRVAAGEDGGFRDAVQRSDESTPGLTLGNRAIRTDEVQVATVDDQVSEHWCGPLKERDLVSVAAVPVRHEGTTYGVLVVYTTRPEAFAERERTRFDVLGRTIGSVIYAAKSRALLFADAVVELEFLVTNPDCLFIRIAADTGCELELDGYVPSETRWILYVAVNGAPPAAVVDAAAGDVRVEQSRVVSEGSTPRVELVVAEASVLHTATAAGGMIRRVTADSDEAHLVVEAPVDIDVREVTSHVQREHPGAEFVARSDHDHDATPVGRPEGLLDELTDRQREALVAAYRAGYFTWPRESTAEEVADALDIASSTLHGHLRKAEEVILRALFDDSSRR